MKNDKSDEERYLLRGDVAVAAVEHWAADILLAVMAFASLAAGIALVWTELTS
jgi:hypothetical protein